MEDVTSLFFNVILVLAIVLLNGFFVAAEFSLVRTHAAKLRTKEYANKRWVKWALKLLENLDATLSATQLGITVASLVLGWWGEHVFQAIFMDSLKFMGEAQALAYSHAIATVLALVLVTFLHVVLGELVMKSLAIRYPEGTLRIVSGPVLLFQKLCRPISRILAVCSTLLLKVFGVTSPAESERVHTSAELAMFVSHSTEKGVLDKSEEEMLHGVFGFSDTVAREVMTPRTDLVTLHSDASFDDVISTIIESGYSRYPIIGESADDVQGVLLARDLMSFIPLIMSSSKGEFDIKQFMRKPYFIPGTKPIDDLLSELKRRKVHIAIVLDEHGGVDGIVTLEDLIEEIVGDIFDEADVPERDVVVLENGEVLVDGGVLVADLNVRFELSIPEGDYDTIAGFIFTTLGRMPRLGDKILVDKDGPHLLGLGNGEPDEEASLLEPTYMAKVLISVEKVKGHRIQFARLRLISKIEEEPESLPNSPSSQGKGITPETELS